MECPECGVTLQPHERAHHHIFDCNRALKRRNRELEQENANLKAQTLENLLPELERVIDAMPEGIRHETYA